MTPLKKETMRPEEKTGSQNKKKRNRIFDTPGRIAIKYIFFFLFSFFLFPCFSQQHSVSDELRFAQYLIDNNQHRDAIYILKKQIASTEKNNPETSDSINYFIGWSYFNLKILDTASFYFSNVKGNPFYHKAAFYNAFDHAYLSKTNEAKSILNTITANSDSSHWTNVSRDSSLLKLCNLQFAGIALLDRDYKKYEEHSKTFSYSYFPLLSEERKFSDYYSRLKKVKKKSPVLAGIMSAVIPGTGKMYAGYKGQGLASMITVGVLGISAAESYYRLGYKSPHFITFGSLFTIFYVGNIWGSAISVKIAREHQVREINDEILFDMHIPLRRIFN